MRRPSWLRGKKAWFTAPLAALLALWLCFTTWNSIMEYKMTTTLTAQPQQTVCMGRFLIDLPGSALPAGSGWRYAYQGHEFELQPNVTLEQYNGAIDKRIVQLQTETLYNLPLFAGHRPLKAPANAHVVLHWDDPAHQQFGTISESFLWLDGKQFISKEYGSLKQHDIPKFMSDMSTFFSRIEPLKPNDIPGAPGYCMENSWIPDQADKMNSWESVSFEFGLSGHPDVRFTLSTRLDSTTPETLLAVEDQNPLPLHQRWRFHHLRKAERTLAHGLPGQELTSRVLDVTGGLMVGAEWQGYFNVPQQGTGTIMSISGRSGWSPQGRVSSSLSEGEMLAVWDFLLDSIRLRPAKPGAPVRPAAPATPSNASAQTVPLGTTLPSGAACPQSGIWKCDQKYAVDGRTSRIAAGSLLPRVMVARELTRWQILRGDDFQALSDANWTLLSYEEAAT